MGTIDFIYYKLAGKASWFVSSMKKGQNIHNLAYPTYHSMKRITPGRGADLFI